MIKDLETTYIKCDVDGIYKIKEEIDIDLIRSLNDTAGKGLAFIKRISKGISKDSTDWTFVFREYYESLRGYIEAYMLFDKVTANNHQCNNAFVCFRHPELGLEWEFLETTRLKRNAVNYKGQLLTYEEWNNLEEGFESHIGILSKVVKEKLATQE